MHPLDGADVRVSSGHARFDRVQREWNATPREAKTVTLSSEYKADLQKVIVTVATVPDMDQRWSIVLSEALFHLRAALDYLAWELATWNLKKQTPAREPGGYTKYPIATAEKDFNNGWVKDLNPSHVTVIKWLQPYSPLHMRQFLQPVLMGADQEGLAKSRVAFWLNSINNTNKHRLLQLVAMSARVMYLGEFQAHDCEVENPNFFIQGSALNVGAKWAEFDVVQVTGDDPRVNVPVEIEATLSYGERNILLDYPLMERYVVEALDIFRPILGAP